jgi:hypothetical protein
MEALVMLLLLLFFVVTPLLPAIITLLARRAGGHGEQEQQMPSAPERLSWSPPRQAIAMRAEHWREDVAASPISLETIPKRPISLDEVRPRSVISLEEKRSPSPARTILAETRPRRRRLLVRGPIDVRRGIVLAALLGPPRADDPYRG